MEQRGLQEYTWTGRGGPFELLVSEEVFAPTHTSREMAEGIQVDPGDVVIDVGSGSGVLSFVAARLGAAKVYGSEVNRRAVALARRNAERLGLAERVAFERGTVPPGRRFDLVVANLPYVRESDMVALEPEITEYEPRQAVVAGEDGLETIATVAAASSAALTDAGAVALEVGAGQAGAAAELLLDLGFGQVEGRQDLAGLPRVVLGRMAA